MLMETEWVILFSQRDDSSRCKIFLSTSRHHFLTSYSHSRTWLSSHFYIFFSLTSQNVCQKLISASVFYVISCADGRWKGLFLPGCDKRQSVLFLLMVSHWPKTWEGRVSLLCAHLQRRCFDVAGVAMRTGTLRTDTLKASARVDASCPAATVVLLAQTLVHIWKIKQWGVTDKHGGRPARQRPCSLVTTVTTMGCCELIFFRSFF